MIQNQFKIALSEGLHHDALIFDIVHILRKIYYSRLLRIMTPGTRASIEVVVGQNQTNWIDGNLIVRAPEKGAQTSLDKGRVLSNTHL